MVLLLLCRFVGLGLEGVDVVDVVLVGDGMFAAIAIDDVHCCGRLICVVDLVVEPRFSWELYWIGCCDRRFGFVVGGE